MDLETALTFTHGHFNQVVFAVYIYNSTCYSRLVYNFFFNESHHYLQVNVYILFGYDRLQRSCGYVWYRKQRKQPRLPQPYFLDLDHFKLPFVEGLTFLLKYFSVEELTCYH